MDAYTRRVPSLFVTWPILLFLGVALLAALLNGDGELIVFSLLVLTAVSLLRLWAAFSPSKIEHDLRMDKERVFAGDLLNLTLFVRNEKPLPLSFEARVPLGPSLRHLSGEEALREEETLFWFQSASTKWELRAVRRGVCMVGPTTLATGDILGFFMEESKRKERLRIIVYPRLVPLHPFLIPGREFFGLPGGESPVEDPVYILGTVDYRHGRPARHIHWKASARHHRLQQKIFEPTEQEKALLMVDVGGFAARGSDDAFERTLEVVASLAVQLDNRGCAVGFLTNGVVEGTPSRVAVTRSPSQTATILEALAGVHMEQGQPASSLLMGSRGPAWGTTCVCFAMEPSGETEHLTAYFSRQRIPFILYTYPDVCQMRQDRDCGPGKIKTHLSSRGRGVGP